MENNIVNEELKNGLDENNNVDDINNIQEYNQQSEILKQELGNNKKLVLQIPSITTFRGPNGILGMKLGRKGNAGFVPMITVAGILVLMGIIIAYIVFGI